MKKKVCENCGAELPAKASICSECGEQQPFDLRRIIARVSFGIVVLFTVFGVSLHYILRSREDEARAKSVDSAAAESAAAVRQAAYEIAVEAARQDSCGLKPKPEPGK